MDDNSNDSNIDHIGDGEGNGGDEDTEPLRLTKGTVNLDGLAVQSHSSEQLRARMKGVAWIRAWILLS
ncbi:hypothetical protein NPX13_g2510 [Xylaria arbuscula]|uniref:Uncharacterized protein n=1 Tax=Xylaria arbuscula TaxID=114810 RepID=A0A9W8NJ18_9PEZI|nr:hypothetical protein NPX13_g2510 [Xylaria arbuscula]